MDRGRSQEGNERCGTTMDRISRIEGLRFPIRPSPEVDESCLGYVLRLVAENGVKLRRDYSLRLFGADLTKLPFNKRCIDEAARLSGAHGDWLRDAAYPVKGSQPLGKSVSFRRSTIKRAWLNLGRPRVCVRCLIEGGTHYRFLWDFRLFRRCLIHGTLLVSKCRNCGRELTWSRWLDLQTEDFRCVCGIRLLDTEREIGNDGHLVQARHCEMGRYLAYRIAPDVYPQWKREAHPDIERLPAESLIDLCLYLGAVADQASAGKKERLSPTDARHVENRVSLGVGILLRWPGAFHITLRRLVRRNTGRGRVSSHTVLSPYALDDALERLGSAESLVRSELKKFRKTAFFREKVVRASRPVRGSYVRLPGTITSTRALAILKLSPSSLRCLLRIAKREGVEHSLHGGQWWFNAKQIHTIAKAYSVLVDLKQLGEVLGFKPEVLSDLRQSFHLRLVMRSINGRRALTCEAEEFQRLIAKATDLPQSLAASGNYLQGMEAVRVFSERGLSCADLVDAIVDDILPATRIAGSDPQTGRFYFERKAIHEVALLLAERVGTHLDQAESEDQCQEPTSERFDRSGRVALIRQWKLEAAAKKTGRKARLF